MTSGDDAYERRSLGEGLAAVAEVLEGIAEATEPVVLTSTPRDGSPGMAELASEAPFRQVSPGWTPVTNTYGYSTILGYAVVDSLRAFAHLLRRRDLLVWSPFTNARSALDAAAFAFWLVEPGISTEARIQRGMAFRLHNAREQRKAPRELTAAFERATSARASVVEQAAELDWAVSGRKQPRIKVGSTEMPTAREAIDAVLRSRQQADHDTAADLSWWFYSGISHATPYALMQFIDQEQARPTGIAGTALAPIYVSGPQFVLAAASAGRATANLTHAVCHVMGLPTVAIDAAEREFTATIQGVHAAMERSRI